MSVRFARRLASKCPKLVKQCRHCRGDDAPLVSSVALDAKLFDDVEVASARSIRKHHARPKDVSHVGDGCEPNDLWFIKESQVHELHALRFSRVLGEHDC
jgi:hypothetical protein